MPLNSALYIVCLLTGCAVFWLMPLRFRACFLLSLSVLFFLYAGVLHLAIALLLTLHTYVVARSLIQKPRRMLLAYGIAVLVLALLFWKLPMAVQSSFGILGTVALPLGISYFTFECIHILADTYRGAITELPFFDMLSCTLFFPTRGGGPIKRFRRFADQLHSPTPEARYFWYGAGFLLLGFAQKIIIADPLAPFTRELQSLSAVHGSVETLVHLYAYSVFIYADFAGLSNIAIGSALLFGIVVPKNFAYPYLQPSIALFWRRWHMSLSDWVRDYIYIPLGGNRVGMPRMLVNLIIPMLIIGAWHGLTANFLAWGLYHGIGLAIHRVWSKSVKLPAVHPLLARAVGIILTFHFVTLGWIFFATDSLSGSLRLLHMLFPIF